MLWSVLCQVRGATGVTESRYRENIGYMRNIYIYIYIYREYRK